MGIEPSLAAALVGDSAAMRDTRALIGQVGPSNASVLITGPSGTGKEVVARAVHASSRRAKGPFAAINCGAIPAELLESELFGHEKGAFTGAVAQVRGRFESAAGGTLFLDEIGDMPPAMQVKLLRVLEERQVTRVGARDALDVDTRIVSATHRDIETAIGEGRFREDLFYRLAVFPIHLPPLAERIEDLPALIAHFVDRVCEPEARIAFTADAVARLMAHRWPGNVRELRNFVERAGILHPGKPIAAEEVDALIRRGLPTWRGQPAQASVAASVVALPAALPYPAVPVVAGEDPVDLRTLVAELEQDHIARALDQAGGVVADAARLLSLRRTTLIEKMQKYGLSRAG